MRGNNTWLAGHGSTLMNCGSCRLGGFEKRKKWIITGHNIRISDPPRDAIHWTGRVTSLQHTQNGTIKTKNNNHNAHRGRYEMGLHGKNPTTKAELRGDITHSDEPGETPIKKYTPETYRAKKQGIIQGRCIRQPLLLQLPYLKEKLQHKLRMEDRARLLVAPSSEES